jgi:hypothetical protein
MSKVLAFRRPKITDPAAIRMLDRIAKRAGISRSAVIERALVLYGEPLCERLTRPAQADAVPLAEVGG